MTGLDLQLLVFHCLAQKVCLRERPRPMLSLCYVQSFWLIKGLERLLGKENVCNGYADCFAQIFSVFFRPNLECVLRMIIFILFGPESGFFGLFHFVLSCLFSIWIHREVKSPNGKTRGPNQKLIPWARFIKFYTCVTVCSLDNLRTSFRCNSQIVLYISN